LAASLPAVPRLPETLAELEGFPGHQIRRLQQIAVAIFLEEVQPDGVTPVQCAALMMVNKSADMDQRTLARSIGFDTSTITGVLDRLEARGLLRRSLSALDARVRLIALTHQGRALLERLMPSVRRAQARMLEPLAEAERADFMRMLCKLVASNNDLSRAPALIDAADG
jgi:DNA-binding MarR family transcriptional regulator